MTHEPHWPHAWSYYTTVQVPLSSLISHLETLGVVGVEHISVGWEWPQPTLAPLLRSVSELADLVHRRDEGVGDVRGALGEVIVRDGVKLAAKCVGGLGHVAVERGAVAAHGGALVALEVLSACRDDASVHHLEHGGGLHGHLRDVLLVQGLGASLCLLGGEDAVLGEEVLVLVAGELSECLGGVLEVEQAALSSLDGPLLAIAVAVKDATPVLLEHCSHSVARRGASLDLVGDGSASIGDSSVEDCERECDVLRGSHSAELEAVAAEWKRSSAVAVLASAVDGLDISAAIVDRGACVGVACEVAALHDLGQVSLEADACVERDDRRRSLLGTEAVVVARSGDGATDGVAVLVDSIGQSSDERCKVSLALGSLARGVEVLAGVGVEAPVVVLAGTVDASEWLLVPEHHQPVASSDIVGDLHRELVLVVGDVGEREDGGELVLAWGDLVVVDLHGHAHLLALCGDLLHKSFDAGGHWAEVVHVGLLVASRKCTQHGAAAHHEVRAAQVLVAINHEELLLPADVGDHSGGVTVAEVLEEAHGLLVDSLLRAQQGGLVVESSASPGNEGGWNVERVAVHPARGHAVPGVVCSSGVRRAKATIRERRPVGLVEEQLRAGEASRHWLDDRCVAEVEVDEGVVLHAVEGLDRLATDWGEPVSVVDCAPVHSPLLHCSCELVGSRLVQRGSIGARCLVLAECLSRDSSLDLGNTELVGVDVRQGVREAAHG